MVQTDLVSYTHYPPKTYIVIKKPEKFQSLLENRERSNKCTNPKITSYQNYTVQILPNNTQNKTMFAPTNGELKINVRFVKVVPFLIFTVTEYIFSTRAADASVKPHREVDDFPKKKEEKKDLSMYKNGISSLIRISCLKTHKVFSKHSYRHLLMAL